MSPASPMSAITGMGMVTPLGIGVSHTWSRLISSQNGITWFEDEYLKRPLAAGLVIGLDPQERLGPKLASITSRFTQLGLIAASEALSHAGFDFQNRGINCTPYDSERIMIAVGTSFGGLAGLTTELKELGQRKPSPRLATRAIPNALASQLAIIHQFTGPALTNTGACAASAQAIGEGHLYLINGVCDMALVGGSDSLFIPPVMQSLMQAGAICSDGPRDDPGSWSRPFDAARQGMVLGEGSAFLVLERPESATARGASIHGYIAGYGVGNDAYHETAAHPDGDGAARVMRQALANSHLQPRDISYVSAHATGTKSGDLAESRALRTIFGNLLDQIPVSSIKGATSHTLGAAGAIEAIAVAMAMKEQTLPPTLNSTAPDPQAPPDIVPNRSRIWKPGPVLSNSFGFGGQNATLVLLPNL